MKINPVFLVALGGLVASCNPTTSQTRTVATPTRVPAPTDPNQTTACYRYFSGKDSVTLRIRTMGNAVKGELTYSFFEKDDNTGTFQGRMKGDTLFAEYTFLSEGTESVREVAFLKKGDDLVEGYGEVREVNNRMVFKDRGALNFRNTSVYKRSDCGKDR